MKLGMIFSILLLTAMPFHARAQEATVPGVSTCDVAVWPAADYQAERMGLVTGGLISELMRRTSSPEINSVEAIKLMLPPKTLFEVVSNSELKKIIGGPINYIFVDKTVDDSKFDRKRKGRSFSSNKSCYIEVHLWLVYYQSAPFHGERIFSFWRIKDFRGPKLISIGGYDNGQMKDFSKQNVPRATELAKGAIVEIFEKIARKKLRANSTSTVPTLPIGMK